MDWSYRGPGGPERWGELSEEYSTCRDGKQQSPINIAGYQRGEGETVSFSYGGNAAEIHNDGTFLHVGFEVGNTLTVGKRIYELQSAHIHTPSEHRLDGSSFPAELHLVHADEKGSLAVVGQWFELGSPSPLVEQILNAAPQVGRKVTKPALGAYHCPPDSSDYYRYDGSKTTPPCDEPVDWYVMRRPRSISSEQVASLLRLGGGPNNRPPQPTGDRSIVLVEQSSQPARNLAPPLPGQPPRPPITQG